ncbi:MAG: sodium:proton antiporter [Methylococcales bacterium]
MNEANLISLTAIGVLAMTCQWVAWRLKLPAILFLLLAGILVGPATGWLNPDMLFGELLQPFVSLSVAIILFEGSLTLKLKEIRGLENIVRKLITTGLISTWIITAVATHFLVNFSWELSFLFGALVVVTGPTVIVPMLRTVRPNNTISNILRWEGIVIDPIGALLAVLVFEFIVSSSSGEAWQHIAITFGDILFTGIAIGAVTGYFLGLILRHYLLPEYLHNLATLSLVLAAFTLSNHMSEESGLLAVTVMGLWLANTKEIHIEDIMHFKEHLSVLLISGLFIILAAQIEFSQLAVLGWSALGVLAAIQFIARPIKVLIATHGSSLRWQEKALIAWIAPRGIVAAAVSALFALRLEDIGLEQAPLIVPLTFTVIIGTVALQSTTARWIAEWLGVAEPDANGLLIVGANSFARSIAVSLNRLGFKTVLTDSNWDNIKTARMEGLATYFGNPLSEHADHYLDLVGLGQLVALSPQPELNALACVRYSAEFSRNKVYSVATNEKAEKRKISTKHRGYTLFSENATYSKLASSFAQGGEIKVTRLSEDFDFDAFLQQYGKRAIPLFMLDANDQLNVVSAEKEIKPKPGWQIVSLVQEEKQPSK